MSGLDDILGGLMGGKGGGSGGGLDDMLGGVMGGGGSGGGARRWALSSRFSVGSSRAEDCRRSWAA